MSKIISLEEAVNIRAGKVIVFTNGIFDLLHVGHVNYLQAAKELGEVLIVGLNSDDSVRSLRGRKRPIVPQNERAQVLAALACVDYVVIFEEKTTNNLVGVLKPDFYAKGGDWTENHPLPEAEIVTSCGGQVCILPHTPGYSTTRLIEIVKGQRHKSTRLNLRRDLLNRQKRCDLIQALVVVMLSILYIPLALAKGGLILWGLLED